MYRVGQRVITTGTKMVAPLQNQSGTIVKVKSDLCSGPSYLIEFDTPIQTSKYITASHLWVQEGMFSIC